MKENLKETLGDDIFEKAYSTLQAAVHISYSITPQNETYKLEQLEQIFGEEDKIQELFPFAAPSVIIRFLPLLFSLILMENQAKSTPWCGGFWTIYYECYVH